MRQSGLVHIIFVGGNERQAAATAALRAELARDGIDVTFVHPCWTRNWSKPLAVVRRKLASVHVLILTTDVPTLLGEELRRSARDIGIPWRSVRARGRAGIRTAINEAVASLPDRRAQPKTGHPRTYDGDRVGGAARLADRESTDRAISTRTGRRA